MERKLAAILAADVVGYSRLMQQDEPGTFTRLRAHRKELFEPEIERHHGRIFKLMGDGLLAEFGSVVDAVECAVVLQREMAERNNDLPEDRRIDIRMGVHLGDVIVEAEDRHGDAVNIAARLQQLAEPGGLCVSRQVADGVKRKVALRFAPRGEERLKNIAEPVAVYRVLIDTVAEPTRQRNRHIRMWSLAATVALLVAAGAGSAWYLWGPTKPATEITAVQRPPATLPSVSEDSAQAPATTVEATGMAAPVAPGPAKEQTLSPSDQGIPVIVVLPFQDLTGDQVQSDLGRGIAEAFITDLSTFPDFEVVSSTSSIAYAGKPIPEVVKSTGATFVIEGSIRRTGDKALITLQLIRGSTDRHLMIAQVEEKLTDPVLLQSLAAGKLRDDLGGMTGALRNEVVRIAEGKVADDLTEYDYYVLGHVHAFRLTEEERKRAGEIWGRGLGRFPGSVLLRCKLSFFYGWNAKNTERHRMVDEAVALPKKSRLDEWYVHYAKAISYWRDGDRQRTVAEAKVVVEMAPFDTLSHIDLAEVMADVGAKDEAIELAKFAVTHDSTPRKWYFEILLNAYRSAGKTRELLELAEAEVHNNPQHPKWWYDVLGYAYSATGQEERAREAYKKFHSLPDPPEQ